MDAYMRGAMYASGLRVASGDPAAPRRRTAHRLSRAGFVIALEAAVAVALVTMIRDASAIQAPPEPRALGAETVAAHPERFRSRTIEVEGIVGRRPTRIEWRDRGTFVLLGKRRMRLLVVPAREATLAGFRAGTPVVVRGTVVVPPRRSRLARRVTSRTAIAERTGAPALVKGTDVEFLR